MDVNERDLTSAELDQVHLGFTEHGRRHGNAPTPRTRISFVATDGGLFVGCATGLRDNRWYHLSDLWVAETHRGRRFGARLLELWERRVAAEGVTNVYAWTTGFQARGFYEARGWNTFAELADYHESGHSRFGLSKALGIADAP